MKKAASIFLKSRKFITAWFDKECVATLVVLPKNILQCTRSRLTVQCWWKTKKININNLIAKGGDWAPSAPPWLRLCTYAPESSFWQSTESKNWRFWWFLKFFVSSRSWLFFAVGFCQFWLLLANIFGKFGYKAFWNLATLGILYMYSVLGSRLCCFRKINIKLYANQVSCCAVQHLGFF